MEEDKDKTIAILRHQYRKMSSDNRVLHQEIAILQYEIDKIQEHFSLENDDYLKIIYGELLTENSDVN